MKCVNATWELRNLGVNTIELEVEKNDAAEKILKEIENYRRQYDAKYVVVKSNTRYPEISLPLQYAGFLLIENQIGLKLTREDALKALGEYNEFFDEISYKLADEAEMKMIFSEIARGIFTTDRIALDPKFGVEIANQRYSFWIKDALSRGAYVFLSLYENTPIGFFMAKTTEPKKSDGLLGGLFNRPEAYHKGIFHLIAGHKCFCDGGGNIDRTFVSSNNLNVLRIHLLLGRKVTGIRNVFVKHYD